MKCNVYVERETREFVEEWRMLEGGWPAEGWPALYARPPRADGKGVECTSRLVGNFSLILLNYTGLPVGARLQGQVLFL